MTKSQQILLVIRVAIILIIITLQLNGTISNLSAVILEIIVGAIFVSLQIYKS